MITRGHLIGKIVDDIATLKYQIETRNKLGLFDLTKVVEDFFKHVLNIVYDLHLDNLNAERTNNPGIDLGDKIARRAYQITSTNTTQKIKDTLKALTSDQLLTYPEIKIFIVGRKQSQYTISTKFIRSKKFEIYKDIVDLDDLLKDVMVLEIDKLDALFSQFNKEFRQIKIEFEPVDQDGNFESSLYNQMEKIPNQPALNALRLKELFDGDEVSSDSIKEFYQRLSRVPRVTRELTSVFVERGKIRNFAYGNHYGILPKTLKNILRLTRTELDSELEILMDADLIYTDEYEVDEEKWATYVVLKGEPLHSILNWCRSSELSVRTLFNTMNFTIMDV